MELTTNYEDVKNELAEVVDLFYASSSDKENLKVSLNLTHEFDECLICVDVVSNGKSYHNEKKEIVKQSGSVLETKRLLKRYSKLCLYETLATANKVEKPWGALTGVRPTKLAYDLIEQGIKPQQIAYTLQKKFYVSEQKANLISEIISNQKSNVKNDKFVDIYVNIPFCTTRCSYCSFLSGEIGKCGKMVEPYIENLIKEIKAVKQIIQEKCYVVKSVYMGGGTPTSLSASQLDRILSELSFPLVNEFTVEAGRPDTITKEKLDVLKNHNVTRISINPQTFNDKILKSIGRNHSAQDIIECYKLALPYNFQINMDFIAGLPGESFASFKRSIETALTLNPHNITVHTLSIKNGSAIKNENEQVSSLNVEKMVNYAYSKLTEAGFSPYYMYRQKHMLSNLENVGYARDNAVCVFNIDSMEEICSIIAVGAGAISKRVFLSENRLERQANVKDIIGYNARVDEMILKKKEFF